MDAQDQMGSIKQEHKNLQQSFRVCSKAEIKPDEYITINLPQCSHTTVVRPRKSLKTGAIHEPPLEKSDSKEDIIKCESKINVGTQVMEGPEYLIEQFKETVMNQQAKSQYVQVHFAIQLAYTKLFKIKAPKTN